MVHADHLGRPIRLTDMTRATVWSAAYDPFGQPWQITGTVTQNVRFPGQFFLLESDLSYNWNRFYDAATGRYTQPDPLRFVDGPSVYGYASASPMMRVDPEGLWLDDRMCPPDEPTCQTRGQRPNLGGGGGGGFLPPICFEDCAAEIRACDVLCSAARRDPRMPNIWAGSYGRCMRGCVSQSCGGNAVK